jgi:hypothetical protein
LYLLIINAEERNGSSQQHDVGNAWRAHFFGYFVYVQYNLVRKLVKFGFESFFGRIVGDIDERGFVRYQPAFGTEVGKIAQRFHGLQRYDKVAFACRDEVGSDRPVADAEVGLYVSASLAHSVYFGLFHV